MAVVKLFYREEKFIERLEPGMTGEKGVLVLDDERKTATMYFVPTATLVEKRTAERLAQNICKVGFVLKNGVRIGVGNILEIKSRTN